MYLNRARENFTMIREVTLSTMDKTWEVWCKKVDSVHSLFFSDFYVDISARYLILNVMLFNKMFCYVSFKFYYKRYLLILSLLFSFISCNVDQSFWIKFVHSDFMTKPSFVRRAKWSWPYLLRNWSSLNEGLCLQKKSQILILKYLDVFFTNLNK